MTRTLALAFLILFGSTVHAQNMQFTLIDSSQSVSVMGDAGYYLSGQGYWLADTASSSSNPSGTGQRASLAYTPIDVDPIGQSVMGQLHAVASTQAGETVNTSSLAHNLILFDYPGGWVFDFSAGTSTARYQLPRPPRGKELWVKVRWNFTGLSGYGGSDNNVGWLAAQATGQFTADIGITGDYAIANDGRSPTIAVWFPGGRSNQASGEVWIRAQNSIIRVNTNTTSNVGGDQLMGHVAGSNFCALNFTIVQVYATPIGSGPPN